MCIAAAPRCLSSFVPSGLASDLPSGPDPIPPSAAKPPHVRRFPASVLLATRWRNVVT